MFFGGKVSNGTIGNTVLRNRKSEIQDGVLQSGKTFEPAIKNNTGDPKALWSKVGALLKAPTGASSASTHIVDDFADYFKNKVDAICHRRIQCTATDLRRKTMHCSVWNEDGVNRRDNEDR